MLTSPRLNVVAIATLCCTSAFSATYYVNPTGGNDSYTGTNGFFPLKTLAVANAKAVAGDQVWLSPGKTFDETLAVKSGVTYDTYFGSTNRAIIRGSQPVGQLSWALKPGSSTIWQAKVPTTSAVTQVFFTDGSNMTALPRARTPNAGQGDFNVNGLKGSYARVMVDGDTNTLNIASTALTAGSNDITGATAFVRFSNSDLAEYKVQSLVNQAAGVTQLDVKQRDPIIDNSWGLALPYPINKDSGYWLENKLWMLDVEGEWYFEPASAGGTSGTLSVWMPKGVSPAGKDLRVAVRDNGIVGRDVVNVKLSNLTVTETNSDAISLTHTTGTAMNNLLVSWAGRRGLAMTSSTGGSVTGSTFDNNTKQGIWLGHIPTVFNQIVCPQCTVPPEIMRSSNVAITGNSITNSGRPLRSVAAVALGEGGTFTGNLVVNSPSAGVVAYSGTRIENNVVRNTCTGFDDCGGIYIAQPSPDPAKLTWNATANAYEVVAAYKTLPFTSILQANGVTVNNNVVDGLPGSADGVLPGDRDTRAIYLDDYVNGVIVSNNLVQGATYGYMLHTAFNNQLTGNLAIASRHHSLYIQQDAVKSAYANWGVGQMYCGGNPTDALCAQRNYSLGQPANVMTRNAMVSSPAAMPTPNVYLNAVNYSGAATAQFNSNRYASTNAKDVNDLMAYDNTVSSPAYVQSYAIWQSLGRDTAGLYMPFATTREAYSRYNADTVNTLSVACPTTVTSNCTQFKNLLTGAAVTFPLKLAPRTSVILVR